MDALSIRERINFYLKEMGLSVSQFADSNDALRNKLAKQLNGTIGITTSTILYFLNKFPDISADWLILGRGPREFADNLAPKVYTQGGAANVASSISFNDHAQQKMPNGTPIDKDLIIQSQELQLQTLRDQNTILRQDNDAFRTLISKMK